MPSANTIDEGVRPVQRILVKRLPFPRNATLNETQLDNLTQLTYLHEASVLNTIRSRYLEDEIYTYSEMMWAFSGRQRSEMGPHLFAVAEEALKSLRGDRHNQSIVISGESGAGKTISARYIMRYFDEICRDGRPETGSIEERVLATNPILEAFGNAKTCRNDNSSRFGKYVQILFNSSNEMVGSNIQTFLLEQTRVVYQATGERNFHIFYQLIAGLDESELQRLGLKKNLTAYHYLNATCPIVKGVDDAEEFAETRKSLHVAGFTEEHEWSALSILAAILHIGNIQLTKDWQGNSQIPPDQDCLLQATRLLGIDPEQFSHWLVKRTIVAGSDRVETDLNISQATSVRDSIAKHLYDSLFAWIVERLNLNLRPASIMSPLRFIGVLDIYGFERFERNSFEQFCINYANEKLQYQFNQQVFRVEQALYEAEGIQWSFIDFADNQPCIEMIEGRQGILKMIEEECRIPNGSDRQLAEKVNGRFDTSLIEPPKFGRDEAFTLRHFAYDVKYDVDGFLEKNRDGFPAQQLELLRSSSNGFVASLIQVAQLRKDTSLDQSSSRQSLKGAQTQSTGLAFKSSLAQLMETMGQTQLHYIRCIKPNESKLPLTFDSPFVDQQLRACGIIETIRISAAGFPGRWSFVDFLTRYRILRPIPMALASISDPRQACIDLLSEIDLGETNYQVGHTKVFLRAGVLGKLEEERTFRLSNAAKIIQAAARMAQSKALFRSTLNAISQIQMAARRFLAQQRAHLMGVDRANQLIVSTVKMVTERRALASSSIAATSIASAWKASKARQEFESHFREEAVTRITANWRMIQERQVVGKRSASKVTILAAVKHWLARQELKVLRVESKSVRRLLENSTALESKIVTLSGRLQDFERETEQYRHRCIDLESMVEELEEELETVKRANRLLGDKFEDFKLKSSELLEAEKSKFQEQLERATFQMEALQSAFDSERSRRQEFEDSLKETKASLMRYKEKEFVAATQEFNFTTQRTASSSDLSGYAFPRHSHQRKLSMDSKMQVIHEIDLPLLPSKKTMVTTTEASRGDILNVLHDSRILEEFDAFVSLPLGQDSRAARDLELSRLPSLLVENWVATWLDLEVEPIELGEHFYHLLGRIKSVCFSASTSAASEGHMTVDQTYSFWMTNLVRILGFLQYLITKLSGVGQEETHVTPTPQLANLMVVNKEQKMTTQLIVLLQMRSESARTIEELYRGWLGELCRWFAKIGPSAIMDYQGLTGYTEALSGPKSFLANLLGRRGSAVDVSTEILVDGLDELSNAMISVGLQSEIAEQILNHVLAHVFAMAFNELLLRKSYATWRRGIQIQYNLSQLEDWATRLRTVKSWVSGPPISQTEALVQAVKLLQLAKTATAEDLPVIIETCPKLSLAQIRRILSSYVPDEFEEGPVSPALMRALALRCQQADLNDSDPNGGTLMMMHEVHPESVPLHLSIKPLPPSRQSLPASLVPPTLWKLFVLSESFRKQA